MTLGSGPVISQAAWGEDLQKGLERSHDDSQGRGKTLCVRTRARFPGLTHRQEEGMQASVSQTGAVR